MEKTVETKFGEITLRDAILDMDGTNLEDGLEVKLDGEYLAEFAGKRVSDFNDDETDETDETDIERLEEFIQANCEI